MGSKIKDLTEITGILQNSGFLPIDYLSGIDEYTTYKLSLTTLFNNLFFPHFFDTSGDFYIEFDTISNLTANRIVYINPGNSNRTLNLSGNLTITGDSTISGVNTGDQTIVLSGDIFGTGTGAFNTQLKVVNSSVGTYGSANTIPILTVDNKGRVTAVTEQTVAGIADWLNIINKPNSLAGYGILNGLTSDISLQNGYFGDINLSDDNDNSHYLTITNSGNITANRKLFINVSDADRVINFNGNLTVQGPTTISGLNTGDQTLEFTGDINGSGAGVVEIELTAVNQNIGTFGNTVAIPQITVDAKGRITAIEDITIVLDWTNVGITGGSITNTSISGDTGSFTELTVANNTSDVNFFLQNTSAPENQRFGSIRLKSSGELSIGRVNDAKNTYTDWLTFNSATGNVSLLGSIESPSLSGTPTTTTAVLGTSNAQVASTEFVVNEIDDRVNVVLEDLEPIVLLGIL